MQVVFNEMFNEFYVLDSNRKFTLQILDGQWYCDCHQSECQHFIEVEKYRQEARWQRLRG